MTAVEKQDLARFIDLSAAFACGGYRGEKKEYQFEDDAPEKTEAAQEAAQQAAQQAAQIETEPAQVKQGDGLDVVAGDIKSCTACRLCETRKNAVPGEGARRPLVLVIGEGPGADEDASGRPFVGKAGQLLDKMLGAIGLSREANAFIANVIKCRPPANRDPQGDETAACASFLMRQINILQPRFILCAGRISAQTVLNTGEPLGRLRGRFIDYRCGANGAAVGGAIPLIVTYHPSAILRNEDYKRPAWEDLKLLRGAIESSVGKL